MSLLKCVPFIKTGGLADVVGSLPKCFDKEYYDVRVVLPKYMCMKEEYKSQTAVHYPFLYGSWLETASMWEYWEWTMKEFSYYFIDNEYYFAGPKPYGNIYEDIEKFAFFSKAALSHAAGCGFPAGYHPLP